jgi:hypothetical protein
MKKQIVALLAGAMMMMATSAMATLISGDVSFNGALKLTGPSTALTVNASNATGIDFSNNYMSFFLGSGYSAMVAGSTTGAYATVLEGTGVVFKDFTFNPSSVPVIDLWSFTVGATKYNFDLLTVNATNVPSNTLALNGTGMLEITGYDPTPGIWSLTTQDASGVLTFSAASAVPEPGTMVLFGMGMLGMAIYGKRRMNKQA